MISVGGTAWADDGSWLPVPTSTNVRFGGLTASDDVAVAGRHSADPAAAVGSGDEAAMIESEDGMDPASQHGRISSPMSGSRWASRPQKPIFAATERR